MLEKVIYKKKIKSTRKREDVVKGMFEFRRCDGSAGSVP